MVIDGVSLAIEDGEMVALIGPSGSGKSTLMRHIAGLVCCDADGGAIEVDGRIVQCSGRIAEQVRRVRAGIGFVFQQFNLVGRLRVIDNVLIGALNRTCWWRSAMLWFRTDERRAAMRCLARVGMAAYAGQRASTLSGGQQQRVAIARALLQGARTILADEPIASLDPESARRVMEALARINREDRATVVVSLHQVDFALRYCPRVVALRAGRLVYDGPGSGVDTALLQRIYAGDHEFAEEPAAPAQDPAAQPSPVLHPVLQPT
jgi:phosphonate transport system ATP-binding protein